MQQLYSTRDFAGATAGSAVVAARALEGAGYIGLGADEPFSITTLIATVGQLLAS